LNQFQHCWGIVHLVTELDRVFIEGKMETTLIPIRAKLLHPYKAKPIEAQHEFLLRITHECRRAERSKRRFLLVLIDGCATWRADVPAIAGPIAASARETDALGWYNAGSTLGILFAELGRTDAKNARDTIVKKLQAALLQAGLAEGLAVSALILPLDLNKQVAVEDSPERIWFPSSEEARESFLR
jgi:hypothetical protein